MRHLFAGAAIFSMAAYAVVGWLPAFLIRCHGLSTAAAATTAAVVLGLIGGAGTLLGGVLADGLGRQQPAWRLRCVAVALALLAPLWTMVLLPTDVLIASSLLVIAGACLGFYLGPTFAMVQTLADPATRATAAALLLLVMNVVGLGLGPLAVGILSDAMAPGLGSDSLRIALLLVPLLCLWAAYHYHAAASRVVVDLESTQSRHG
jgi:MFS family permease